VEPAGVQPGHREHRKYHDDEQRNDHLVPPLDAFVLLAPDTDEVGGEHHHHDGAGYGAGKCQPEEEPRAGKVEPAGRGEEDCDLDKQKKEAADDLAEAALAKAAEVRCKG